MKKVKRIIPDVLIGIIKKQVNTIVPQTKKCEVKIIVSDEMIFELTKSELKICKLFSNTGSFEYSYRELSNMLDISKQTVCSGLKKLIEKGYIKKIRFFEGRMPRNRYVALEKLNVNQKTIYY